MKRRRDGGRGNETMRIEEERTESNRDEGRETESEGE